MFVAIGPYVSAILLRFVRHVKRLDKIDPIGGKIEKCLPPVVCRTFPPDKRVGWQSGKPDLRSRSLVLKRAVTDCLLLVALVAAVFLTYQPAWQGGMLWDDEAHVTLLELRSLDGLGRIWFDVAAWHRVDQPWYKAFGATQQYYPLLHSFFWLQWQLWGDATLGYHLVNIALHAIAAVLVALLLRRLKIPGALLAAAIFALHPVQVESVAWITEQKNTLSAVFYLAAALMYLRFDQSRRVDLSPPVRTEWTKIHPALSYTLAFGLFVLGLLSKTVTATLPAALLVVFWWQRGKLSWRRDVLPLTPFFLLATAAGALTAYVERKLIGAEGAEFELTIIERLLMAGRVVWFYLGKLCWPAELIFFYPRWGIDQAVWWQYLYPLAAVLLVAVLGLLAFRYRWRAPLAGVLFFVGTLFPVLGFFNVYPFRFSLVADHFQYLASLGIIALAAAGLALLWTRFAESTPLVPREKCPSLQSTMSLEGPSSRRSVTGTLAGYGLCLLLLAALAVLSWRQSRMYADNETLYLTTIERNPQCWIAYDNWGFLLIGRGQFDEGVAYCRKAQEINPGAAEPYNHLGLAAARRGRYDEAIACFEQSVAIRPDFIMAQNNLGGALMAQGRLDEAIAHCRKALEINPDYVEALSNLGVALMNQWQFEEAALQYRRALELRPNDAQVYDNLGHMAESQGHIDAAIAHYRKALEIKPDHAAIHSHLGVSLTRQGQVDEAIEHFRQALRIKPDNPEVSINLGSALASQGRFDEAIAHYRSALAAKPDNPTAHNNLGSALAKQGQLEAAIVQFQEALRCKPDYREAFNNVQIALNQQHQRIEATVAQWREAARVQPDQAAVLNRLAWALATCPLATVRNGTEAVPLAQRAVTLSEGKEPVILDTLAAAYAEAGQFAEATSTAELAFALAQSRGETPLADRIRGRLELYRAGQPYREHGQSGK
jgi:protein O-mannosyl-transferase